MLGLVDKDTVERAKMIMDEMDVGIEDRPTVKPAQAAAAQAQHEEKGHDGVFCGAAIELKNGSIVTGKNSPLMHAAAATVLNAIKTLAGLPDGVHLIAPNVIESIGRMKDEILVGKSVSLDLEEALIAVGASTSFNPAAQLAIEQLKHLRGCEMHMTHIPTPGDEAGLRTLGVNLTTDPCFTSERLFAR
jgi:uncharacterized protein (UPF0371 family)